MAMPSKEIPTGGKVADKGWKTYRYKESKGCSNGSTMFTFEDITDPEKTVNLFFNPAQNNSERTLAAWAGLIYFSGADKSIHAKRPELPEMDPNNPATEWSDAVLTEERLVSQVSIELVGKTIDFEVLHEDKTKKIVADNGEEKVVTNTYAKVKAMDFPKGVKPAASSGQVKFS